MADLTDLQAAQTVKVAGANPATGAEDSFMEVDSSGRVSSKISDSSGSAINLGQTTMSASVPVVIASDQTAVPISATAATGTHTNVTSSASDQTILASNASRKGFTLYNDSTKDCYVLFGSGTSSSTNFSVKMAPGAYYENPNMPVYTGVIKGVWAAANGAMRVTEYT